MAENSNLVPVPDGEANIGGVWHPTTNVFTTIVKEKEVLASYTLHRPNTSPLPVGLLWEGLTFGEFLSGTHHAVGGAAILAAIGAAVGGPVGAAVGAAAGVGLGLLSHSLTVRRDGYYIQGEEKPFHTELLCYDNPDHFRRNAAENKGPEKLSA